MNIYSERVGSKKDLYREGGGGGAGGEEKLPRGRKWRTGRDAKTRSKSYLVENKVCLSINAQ